MGLMGTLSWWLRTASTLIYYASPGGLVVGSERERIFFIKIGRRKEIRDSYFLSFLSYNDMESLPSVEIGLVHHLMVHME